VNALRQGWLWPAVRKWLNSRTAVEGGFCVGGDCMMPEGWQDPTG